MEQKKQGMTREELAGFTARANKYFKGETDRELWSLALPRIAEESAEVAMAALENYSIQWGGPRARFLPAKYFEFLADVKVRRLELTQREAREREARMRSIAASRDAAVCEADWLSRRREIETANPLEVGEAVDYLRSLGWGNPPESFGAWSRPWILAVSDLVCRRTVAGYDRDQQGFEDKGRNPLRPVSAATFYREAGKAVARLA
jgi:hypothetical protein